MATDPRPVRPATSLRAVAPGSALRTGAPGPRAANRGRARRRRGADPLTTAFTALAVFLLLLAFLAVQLRAGSASGAHRVVLIRRVYQTKVIETVPGGGSGSSSLVSQSVGGTSSMSAPATHTS
jgi:hypothetical protein